MIPIEWLGWKGLTLGINSSSCKSPRGLDSPMCLCTLHVKWVWPYARGLKGGWRRYVFAVVFHRNFCFITGCSFDASPHKLKSLAQSCTTLCDPVDCSPPGSSFHGILQARILEWVAISFSRGSSRPRDRTQVSCFAGRRFNLRATREAQSHNLMTCPKRPHSRM